MASYLSLHRQQGKQAFRDLLSRPLGNLLTVLVLAFSLALPATLFMLAKNVMMVTDEWTAPNQLTLYLKDMPLPQAKSFSQSLEQRSDIASVEYISPEQGLNQFRQIQGFEQAISLLDENPLPAVVIVGPASDDISIATALASKLRLDPNVDEVRLDSDWLRRLSVIESLVLKLSVIFSGLMFMAVFLIIGNTLRLQVLNHKQEIQVMKLVGATDSYILRPYLYTGMWLALAGALLAWIVTLIINLLLDTVVVKLATLYSSTFRLTSLHFDEVLILCVGSCLLGHLAARIAAGRHLREIEPV